MLAKRGAFILILILLGFCNKSIAQADSSYLKNKSDSIAKAKMDSLAKAKKSYFEVSLSYLSNAVYNGRHDSLVTPYITPTIEYHNKSGFYINGSLSYLSNSEASRIDLFALEAGYDFTIIKDKFTGSVNATRSFYNDSSTAIQSDIKATLGGSLSYDFDIVQLTIEPELLFGTKTDISTNLSLAHEFDIANKKSLWSISPTVSADASTLNFYEGYINRKAGKKAKARYPNVKTVTLVTTVNGGANTFTLMDYELSLPIAYDTKKWGISFTPKLAIPQNSIYTTTTTTYTFKGTVTPPIVETQNSTPYTEKKLQNVFYFEVLAYVKF